MSINWHNQTLWHTIIWALIDTIGQCDTNIFTYYQELWHNIIYEFWVITDTIRHYDMPFMGDLLTQFSTLMLFWLILEQGKTIFVVFLWKRRTSSATILFLMAYIRPLEIISWPKRQLSSFSFFIKKTKLVFFWPNMGQKSCKVLKLYFNERT